MARVPVEIIVRALDKTAPALASMSRRMTALRAFASRANPFAGLTKALGESAFGRAAARFGRAVGVRAIEAGLGKVKGQLRTLAGTLPGLGVRLLGIGTAGAAIGIHLLKSAAESGDALARMSKQAGVTADYFASTQFAAEQAGVGGEVFAKSMQKLSKQLGEMTVGKGGPLLAFLNQVSPKFARQVKATKSTEEAMGLLADAFARIENPQKRATLAAKVFGDEAVQMGEFLHAGNTSIEERRKRFLQLAGSQEELARNSAAFQRALGETSVAFGGLRNAVAAQLLPVFTTLASTLTTFIAAHRDGLKAWAEKASAAIMKWVESGGLERLINGISTVASAALKLAETLGPTGTAIAGIAALSPSTTAALLSLGATFLRLGLTMVPPLISALWGAGSALVSFAAAAIPPAVAALGSFAASAWAAAAPVLPFVAAAAGLALAGKSIYDHWDELAFIFRDWGNSLRWAIIDTWPKIRPVLEKLSGFLGPLGGGFTAALSVGDAAVQKLTPEAAAAAAPVSSSSSSTRVQVDFSNLPRGARVSTQSNADAVDTSLGYSSMVPDA